MKRFFSILKITAKEFFSDDCASMAGALAYYIIFSLPGMIFLLIFGMGLFLERKVITGEIQVWAQQYIGRQGAEQMESIIRQAMNWGTEGIFAATLGLITFLFGATGAFAQLQTALNRTWDVKPAHERGILKEFLMRRLLSLFLVVLIAILLLLSFLFSAALSGLEDLIKGRFGEGTFQLLFQGANIGLSFLLVFLLIAAIFKFMPDAKIAWRNVWMGAAFTAGLFTLGKFVIGYYMGRTAAASAYGAASSLAIMLIWTYYTAMIFLFGAEFTQVYSGCCGIKVDPVEGAERAQRKPLGEEKEDVEPELREDNES